jgi:hypothetical protein
MRRNLDIRGRSKRGQEKAAKYGAPLLYFLPNIVRVLIRTGDTGNYRKFWLGNSK